MYIYIYSIALINNTVNEKTLEYLWSCVFLYNHIQRTDIRTWRKKKKRGKYLKISRVPRFLVQNKKTRYYATRRPRTTRTAVTYILGRLCLQLIIAALRSQIYDKLSSYLRHRRVRSNEIVYWHACGTRMLIINTRKKRTKNKRRNQISNWIRLWNKCDVCPTSWSPTSLRISASKSPLSRLNFNFSLSFFWQGLIIYKF